MKLILNDGTEYEAKNGALPGTVTVQLDSYNDIQKLEESLAKEKNLDKVTLGEDILENLATLKDMSFSVSRNNGKIEAIFMLRRKTDQEIAMDIKNESIETVVTYLTDQQALTVKDLCKCWEDDPDGYHYSLSNPEDLRRQYGGNLWKLQMDHNKQADWYPGAAPTLWVQIAKENDGTAEDPIPVPDSVTTSGFEYVYGKYYLDGDTIYLCQRQGIPNPEELYGQTVKLFYFPSGLAGQYFVLERAE